MPVNLRGRSVLKLLDFTPDEMQLLSGLLEKAWRKTDKGEMQGAP